MKRSAALFPTRVSRVRFENVQRNLLVLVFVLFTSGSGVTRAAIEATLGTNVEYGVGREFVSTRVEEDGYYFTTSLNATGAKGRELLVTIYSESGQYLGYRSIVAPYDNTDWSKLAVFVPYSRLTKLDDGFSYNISAVSPKSTDAYLSQISYKASNLNPPSIIWDWRGFDNDMVLAGSKELGFVARLLLNIRGRKNVPVRMVGLVRNERGGEYPESMGGPFRIDGGPLTPPYDNALFPKLELWVPYAKLASLPPAEIVTLTPAIEINGNLEAGNVHFRFLAGGSLDRVEKLTRDQIKKDSDVAEALRRQMEILRQGGKR